MKNIKSTVVKGCRDFLPQEMLKRNYIFDVLKKIFGTYGFTPIETPAMESLSTLMGKYGEEGDKLLFKIINSGNFLNNLDLSDFSAEEYKKLLPLISDKGLRYDLTVPFARFVSNHRNELQFPFRRYQIQPVWRADRPQKGRYREFYQCDIDIIGSDSMLNEAELIRIVDEAFISFGLPVEIKVNNRKILSAIAILIEAPERIIDLTVAIDKIDKIGIEAVVQELRTKGFSESALEKVNPILNLQGNISEKLSLLKNLFAEIPIGIQGIEELTDLFSKLDALSIRHTVDLDLTLARGLNYYTGAIFEVKAKDVSIGSICGGGRYDNLTGVFGLPDVSGVGISFGADRIYDCLTEKNLFPEDLLKSSQLMFVNFGEQTLTSILKKATIIRSANISTEIYPDEAKMKKQLSYANSKGIPFVAIIGEEEQTNDKITLKNMQTGEQQLYSTSELIRVISQKA